MFGRVASCWAHFEGVCYDLCGLVVGTMYACKRPAKSRAQPFGAQTVVFAICLFVFALQGEVPVVGEDPSVPQSLGLSSLKGRAAHEPRQPAVNKSIETLLVFCSVLCLVLDFGEIKFCCSVFKFQGLEQCIGFWTT